MVIYFKKLNTLFMLAGALIGLLLGVLVVFLLHPGVTGRWFKYLFLAPAALGAFAGRIFSSYWCSKKMKSIDAILYQQNDPNTFIGTFEPLVNNIRGTMESVIGYTKIAYAFEALGKFEVGIKALEQTDTRNFKEHSLQITALADNQKLRLYLLMEDTENASKILDELREYQEATVSRIPAFSANLKESIHLGEIWMNIIQGGAGDPAYLKEEISLAKNDIHKYEMKLLLSRSYQNSGNTDGAISLLKEIAEGPKDFYSVKKAQELLNPALEAY